MDSRLAGHKCVCVWCVCLFDSNDFATRSLFIKHNCKNIIYLIELVMYVTGFHIYRPRPPMYT
jgi:hypothetical protein